MDLRSNITFIQGSGKRGIFYVCLFTAVALLAACEQWDLELENFPEVTTLEFEPGAALPTEGSLHGAISGMLEDGLVERHGHVWALSADAPPTFGQNLGITALGKKGNGNFQSSLNGLTPEKTYSYRAYIIYENQVEYGELRSFTTNGLSPVLRIDSISNNEAESFKVSVYTTVSNLPVGLPVQAFGITWGNDTLPEISTEPSVLQQGIIISEPTFQFEVEVLLSPGKRHLRPFLVVGDATYYGPDRLHGLGNAWVRRADLGGAGRNEAVSFSIGQKGYIGTGFDGNERRKDFWEYDPQNDTWAQMADLGGPGRCCAAGFAIGQKGYIGTGYDGEEQITDFWEYDPLIDTWTRKADFPGGGRELPVGFAIGQKGYLGTGWDGSLDRRDFWEYDPQDDTWTRKHDFAGASRDGAFGFAIGLKGYIGLGSDTDGILRSDFWEYDPENNSWTVKADFGGAPRDRAISLAIGQKGYAGMGRDGNFNFRRDFWEYDPEDATDGLDWNGNPLGKWRRKADFGGNDRGTPVGFAIGQRGFVGTGWDGSYNKDLWEFFPE